MGNEAKISILLTPHNIAKLDLEPLVYELKNDNRFVFNGMFTDFLVEFYYMNFLSKVLVYNNGMINYTENINEEDISSSKILVVFKNCTTALKNLNISTQYEKTLGIFIKGKDQNACYEKCVCDFGRTLFKNPYFRDMNSDDTSSTYSMFIEEKSDLVFEL